MVLLKEGGGDAVFCPKCKDEFVSGVTECPDCTVHLVKGLPSESGPVYDPVYVDLVTVLETGDPGVIMVVKSILEAAGIKYYAKGEGVQHLFGAGTFGSGFNPLTGPVCIQVAAADKDDALLLLKDI